LSSSTPSISEIQCQVLSKTLSDFQSLISAISCLISDYLLQLAEPIASSPTSDF